MSSVKWTRQAQADLREIGEYYYKLFNKATSKQKIATIHQDIAKIANNSMLARHDPKLSDRAKYWFAIGTDFRIYYTRITPNSIRVLRVWPSRREPLKLEEIVPG